MGQNIKALRNRIKSVDSTLHLTKAMGLVASSKIKRANEAMLKGRSYKEALQKTINLLSNSTECQKSPYLQDRGDKRTRIIVIAGDRGMAGGYNANIFRLMRNYEGAEVIALGKRACDRYSKPFKSSEHFTSIDAYNIALSQCGDFLKGNFDKLLVVSTEYVSVMSQEPMVTQLLPIQKGEKVKSNTIFEPDELSILNLVVVEYVAGVLTALVRESFACEVTARRSAMDSAGKNATEMIEELQLSYNRARQSAITQEITEIVAGSGN
ncbi:MAG: ATP synthase F1 subunit gamma [Clostridia bacterium]|nr:ATP synthase F1 subunit gamma [Clostridia bacterium]MBQ7788194.1 ATP synthase F1 subunit gamma [Clostridia bacterium]